MGTKTYRDLVLSIKENGLNEPIWMYEDKILDGEHRHKACLELGIKPEFRDFKKEHPNLDPLQFCIDQNLTRRDLTKAQKAKIAQEIANMKRGDNRFTKENKKLVDASQDASTANRGVSQEEAAKGVGISRSTLQRRKIVEEKGTSLLKEAVDEGKITVKVGAKIASLDEKAQDAQVTAIINGEIKAAQVTAIIDGVAKAAQKETRNAEKQEEKKGRDEKRYRKFEMELSDLKRAQKRLDKNYGWFIVPVSDLSGTADLSYVKRFCQLVVHNPNRWPEDRLVQYAANEVGKEYAVGRINQINSGITNIKSAMIAELASISSLETISEQPIS